MRVKTEAKRLAILHKAGELFLEHGYAAVSLVSIAETLGFSRVTLYNYFSTKEDLFLAFVMEVGAERDAKLVEASSEALSKLSLRNRLTGLGCSYLRLVLEPKIVEVNRLVIGEARRFPELARLFYDVGPRITLTCLENVCASEMRHGRLHRTPVNAAALHFKGLCEGALVDRRMWGLDGDVQDQELRKTVATAVRVFMKAYATDRTGDIDA